MGFFSNLGSKVSHAAHAIGAKATHIARKGVKIVADEAGTVSNIADKVSGVAGTLATGAAMIGLEPIAAGLAAGAAAAKGVSKVADIAGTAARAEQNAERAVKAGSDTINKLRAGDISGAITSGITAGNSISAAKNFGITANLKKKELQRKK